MGWDRCQALGEGLTVTDRHTALTFLSSSSEERAMRPPKEEGSPSWGTALAQLRQVAWSHGSLVGGDMPYLQSLGKPNKIPLHLLAGLQLSL